VSLDPWLEPLPDAEQMQATDRWAIEEQGIASLDLMERAGQGLVKIAEQVALDGPIAVVCGPGNNGGDGYVAARLWRDHGREVHVLTVGEAGSDDAVTNAKRLTGDRPKPFTAEHLDGCVLIVDALLGTGATGAPRDEFAAVIAAMNAAKATVVAADVPSGVDASTGEIAGDSIKAAATATFAAAKPGLWIHPGKAHAGEVHVIDIGIPRDAPVDPQIGLIQWPVVDLIASRGTHSTKFTSGHVLVAGGSRGLTGAPCLSSTAAMRTGAGYVTACVPASLEAILEAKLTEVMTVGLPDRNGSLGTAAGALVLDRCAKAGSLVVGPGLGPDGAGFALEVAASATIPLVLDADGLNAHAGQLDALAGRDAPTILTPHAGELARLLETDSGDVSAHRLAMARGAAERSQSIVVLKGDDTIIAEPGGRTAINPGGSPGLATAGTGDVLSGIIGALLAQRLNPFDAACAAVWIHCIAGRRAAVVHGSPNGVIAGDVVAEIPKASYQPSGARR
jgi:NAD(P)H-hydrate epimerase